MSDPEIVRLGKVARSRIEEGQYSDAEYFFKQITKIDANNWHAWYGRGLCFKRMKMYERGIFCFDKVTELNPESPKGWYNLGFCQSQIFEIEDALYNLNRAIKLDSSYAIAKIIKAWIFIQHNNENSAKKLIEFVRENNPEFLQKLNAKEGQDQPEDYQIALELMQS